MTISRSVFAILAFGALSAPPAHADWVGTGEAGALLSRGNADATSANAKLDVSRESGLWKNSAFLGLLYGENAAFATAQRAEARWQTDYKLTERLFWFGALRGEQDRFSGFQYQATLSTGVGYKFIENERTKFSGTLGAGYRRLRPETLVKSDAGEVLSRFKGEPASDAVASAGLDLDHQITATTKVLGKLLVEAGAENTAVQNDIALQVSMTEALALSVGYGVRYNTEPPVGSKSTDQLTTVNLVYHIK
jgi:putative salt-induced outer membrane protein